MSEATNELKKRLESTELFKHLQDEDEKTATLHVFDIAQTRLVRVDELYHDYSSHGMNHAIRTAENLSYLMVKCNILERLTHSEVFLLICATLIHDIGMGPIIDTEMANFVSGRISPKIKTNWRKDHHNRAREYISTSQEFSFIENGLRERIGDIARGHREVNLLRSDDFFSNPVDCFLGASLRLADQMDLSPERVQERLITRDVLNVLSQTTNTDEKQNQLKEFLKNFAEKKWQLIFLEELPIITLDSEIPVDKLTIETLEALESLVYDIEETLEETKDVLLHGMTLLPRLLHYSFHVQRAASQNHVLRANLPRVWEYLNVYMYNSEDRPKIAIREALANAIDACSIQMNIDPSSECCVHVKHLKDRIVIEDNGIGMSLRTIEENLKSLGSSFYDSPSFRSNQLLQRPVSIIGQFGSGVFSYLLVCDHFEIITSDASGTSFRILMSNRFVITI
ncbi:MAG: ATP-binding protein, partial [Candidatus Thorarchaeota archaeon]